MQIALILRNLPLTSCLLATTVFALAPSNASAQVSATQTQTDTSSKSTDSPTQGRKKHRNREAVLMLGGLGLLAAKASFSAAGNSTSSPDAPPTRSDSGPVIFEPDGDTPANGTPSVSVPPPASEDFSGDHPGASPSDSLEVSPDSSADGSSSPSAGPTIANPNAVVFTPGASLSDSGVLHQPTTGHEVSANPPATLGANGANGGSGSVPPLSPVPGTPHAAVTVVPEPGQWATGGLFGTALLMSMVRGRRRRPGASA